MTTLDQLWQAPNLRTILDEAEQKWQDEQRRRHEFWVEVDENVKAEFILGEIIYHSPVYGRHWIASSNITTELLPYVYDNKLGEVGYEKVMVRLTRNDYEPDICFWSTEKAAAFQPKQSAFPPPDFVIEILSDSTRDRDRNAGPVGIKMTDYALHGVQEYWIVDTEQEAVEQYIVEGNTYQLAQKLKDGQLSAEAVPGFSISVKAIFAD